MARLRIGLIGWGTVGSALGRLVAAGPVRQLIGASGSVYLEVTNLRTATRVLKRLPGVRRVTPEAPGLSVEVVDTRRADLVKALVEAGVGVETVTARHRLEDAFLGMVGDETQ